MGDRKKNDHLHFFHEPARYVGKRPDFVLQIMCVPRKNGLPDQSVTTRLHTQILLLRFCVFVAWKCAIFYFGESDLDLAFQTRKVWCMPWFEDCMVFHFQPHLSLLPFLNTVAFLLVTG